MTKYDVVIVGSGLGGLVSGYILSKHGYRVLILEKHFQVGGCLQTFKRSGTVFDTGMHYIGSMDENQILHKFFKYLSLLDDVKISKLDEKAFDIISIQDKQFNFAMGFENFIEELSAQFPNEHINLRNYIHKIRQIASESPLYNLQEINQNVFLNTDSVKTSVNEFVESYISNPLLQKVLVGNLPLYAGVKDKTPLYIHALINNFYIQSAYRIVGGSDSIALSLTNSIRKMGGEIMTNAEVVKFNCNEDKVVSIELKNGEVFEGKNFISNIHPQATIEKIDSHLIRKAYRDRISQLENTISNFTVYIKFKKNTVKYLNSNVYHYSKNQVWGCENYKENEWPLNYLFMHQAPSELSEFAGSAQMIAYMRYEEVKKWKETKLGNRGSEYQDFKNERTEKMLQVLEQKFPGIRSGIESVYSSSPLTYRDYTATKEGSMYGVLRDKNFPTQTLVSQRTRIANLFMTGQNINSHGILGVTIGAIITCSEFLGVNNIIKDINHTV